MHINKLFILGRRLDPRLFKFCRTDAENLCGASGQWFNPEDMTPETGPHTFSCLYSHYKMYSGNEDRQVH